ncbi:hypothetical protein E4U19_003685 [Claviceps sp. Clav32 group G5]|nr:hypothetical protein E4U19_003685 [Claviceps sp. Clav32 group G5]
MSSVHSRYNPVRTAVDVDDVQGIIPAADTFRLVLNEIPENSGKGGRQVMGLVAMNLLRCFYQRTCWALKINDRPGIDGNTGILAGLDDAVLACMNESFVEQAKFDLLGYQSAVRNHVDLRLRRKLRVGELEKAVPKWKTDGPDTCNLEMLPIAGHQRFDSDPSVQISDTHSCCNPDDTLQRWITNLKRRAGIDDRVEREHARRRYKAALIPMRGPNQWNTWLTEYDQASGHAEAVGVTDLLSFDMVSLDFGDAVARVAPNWVPGFMDNGRFEPNMDRREMMKRFRDHMTRYHPLEKNSRVGVFVTADDQSSLADGGASTQSRKRDASASTDSAPVPKRPKRKNNAKATTSQKPTETTKKQSSLVRCPPSVE